MALVRRGRDVRITQGWKREPAWVVNAVNQVKNMVSQFATGVVMKRQHESLGTCSRWR